MQITRNHPDGARTFPLHSTLNGCNFVTDDDTLEPPNPVLKYNFISCIYFK